MRFMNATVILFTLVFLASFADVAQAKSDKYKRPTAPAPSEKPAAAKGFDFTNPPPAVNTPGTSNGQSPDKKVDLTDLENRYWTAKDTEFKVVQNRLYTKDHRISLTPSVGTGLSDQYSTAYNFGLSAAYYFSERSGVEINGWYSSATDGEFVGDFANRFGTMPDHNLPQYYVGANYNWVPVYAKISFLEKKILYFDMFVSPGIGVTGLKSKNFVTTVSNPPTVDQTLPTLALDVGQQVFFGEHWAVRLDLRNHVYQEKIYKADTAAELRTKTTYSATFMLGVSFFIDTVGNRDNVANDKK